jgi:ribosomal protein S18 acetylase RimI-like enzyme
LNIRYAKLADAQAIAEVHVASWQHTYRGIVPDVYLDSMTVTTRAKVWSENLAQSTPKVIVVEAESKVVGFCSFGRCRDKDAGPKDGEIWAIYLAPLQRSKGFGWALWQEAHRQFLAQGIRRISLWVIDGNQHAMRFYRKAGFEPEMESLKTFELAGAHIPEVRYTQMINPI